MPAASLTISGSKTGLVTGTQTIGPLTITNNASGDAVSVVALTSGANTITVPGTNYVAAVIVPPSNSTNVKTLKGVTGDTGIVLANALPFVLVLASTQTTFVINSAGAETIEIQWC